MAVGALRAYMKTLSMALRARIFYHSPLSFICLTQLQHLELPCSNLAPTNARRLTDRAANSRGHTKVKDQLGLGKNHMFQCPDDAFRRAVSLAVQDHLRRKWGLFESDVARAVEYAPRFVMKARALFEATGGCTECKNQMIAVKARVETLLKDNNALDEIELFLESIGKKEDVLEALEIELHSDRGLVAVTRLLERYDFPRTGIYGLIQKQNCLLSSSESKLKKTLNTLEAYGFTRVALPRLVYSCPSVLDSAYFNKWQPLFCALQKYPNRPIIIQKILKYCRRFGVQPVGPQNYEDNVKFLSSHRIGPSYIAKFLQKCPLLFFLNRYTHIEPTIRVLKGAGVRNETIHDILRKFLNVVTYRPPTLVSKIKYLKSIGLGRRDLDQVCSRFPAILGHSVEDKLKPLVAELESLGFVDHKLVKAIVCNPYVFSMKVGGELSRCVTLLKNLNCRKPIKDKILEQGIIRGSRRVKARVECLTKHGLSHREAFKLLEKEPRIIIYDLQCIEQKVKYMINDMGFPVNNLVEVPDYLGVNFQKQILPRHKVIAYLKSRGGLGMEVTLKTIMKLTRNQFYNRFVRPYPDCEKIFGNCVLEEEIIEPEWDIK